MKKRVAITTTVGLLVTHSAHANALGSMVDGFLLQYLFYPIMVLSTGILTLRRGKLRRLGKVFHFISALTICAVGLNYFDQGFDSFFWREILFLPAMLWLGGVLDVISMTGILLGLAGLYLLYEDYRLKETAGLITKRKRG